MARGETEKGSLVRHEEPGMLSVFGPRGSAFRELDEMRRSMDRLFNSFFGNLPFGIGSEVAAESGIGAVDLYETDAALTLTVELPGMDQKDVNVSVTPDSVTVSGERKQEEHNEEGRYHWRQASYGSFRKTIPLPVSVKPDEAKAAMKNGVLKITLPKEAAAAGKAVKIETEES